MLDILFMTCIIGSSALIGLAFTTHSTINGGNLAAPVIGFGLIATVLTLAYRYGATADQNILIVGLMAAIGAIATAHGLRRKSVAFQLLPFAMIAIIAILCILPKWIGGVQFYAFQNNAVDQVNYLRVTTAYGSYTYDFLKSPPSWWAAAGNMNLYASWMIDQRPGVNIVQAAFMKPFFSTALEAYPPYMASLQIMMFFAVSFIVVQITGPSRLYVSLLVGAAFAIGPLFIHIVDLNAWSQTAGVPLAFLSIGLGYAVLSTKHFEWPAVLSLSIALSGTLFIYPEVAAVVVVAGTSMGVAQLAINREIRPILFGGLSAIIATAVACLYYSGTIGFLQLQTAWSGSYPHLDWAMSYDRQLLGKDIDYAPYLLGSEGAENYVRASLPVDVTAGLLGLTSLLPTSDVNIYARIAWKLVVALALLSMLVGAGLAVFRKRDRLPLIIGLAACWFIPFYALSNDLFWTAGKSISMASPATFILIMLPLMAPIARYWRVLPAVVLTVHILSGLARPYLATDPDGTQFVRDTPAAAVKTATDWAIVDRAKELRECEGIHLNINDAIIDTYVQVALTSLGFNWRSLQPIRPAYQVIGDPVMQKPGMADCLVTDANALVGYAKTIDLRHTPRHTD